MAGNNGAEVWGSWSPCLSRLASCRREELSHSTLAMPSLPRCYLPRTLTSDLHYRVPVMEARLPPFPGEMHNINLRACTVLSLKHCEIPALLRRTPQSASILLLFWTVQDCVTLSGSRTLETSPC